MHQRRPIRFTKSHGGPRRSPSYKTGSSFWDEREQMSVHDVSRSDRARVRAPMTENTILLLSSMRKPIVYSALTTLWEEVVARCSTTWPIKYGSSRIASCPRFLTP